MSKTAVKQRALPVKTVNAYQKRARRGMVGFCVSWMDKNPFADNAEIKFGGVDHANPINRIIFREMWNSCKDWIVNSEFVWQVTIRVIFTGTARGDCYVDFDCNYTGSLLGKKSEKLNDILKKCLDEALDANKSYKQGHKNKGVYDRCEFMAVISGC